LEGNQKTTNPFARNQPTPQETNSLERDHSFPVDSVSNVFFVVGISSGIARISGRMFSLPKTLKRKVEVVETFQEVNMNDFSKIQIIQISFFELPLFRVKKQLIEFKKFSTNVSPPYHIISYHIISYL